MAIYFDWNGRDIFRCTNSVISVLYSEIENIIREKKITLNKDLTELMQDFEQAGTGIGFNLAEYLHTKEDILMFIDLIRKGIDRYNDELPDTHQNIRDSMEVFYQELIKIAESFPD